MKVTRHHIAKGTKITLLLVFLVAIPAISYFAYSTLMLSNRVKVRIVNAADNKPVSNKTIIFRSTECEPQPCQGKVLVEVKTSFFGNATLSTKQLHDSFRVEVNGYKTTDEYLRSPGSLLFSRQNDAEFYSVDVSQGDLLIKVATQ